METIITLTNFTPGEAERITSVTTAQQRDWRRREILPSSEGHARFDVFAIAEMWTLKLLSDRGIGPQQAKEVAAWCATGIVWHALSWGEAYEGDHGETFRWEPAIFAAIQERAARMDAWVKKLEEGAATPQEMMEEFREPGFSWRQQSEWLRRRLFEQEDKGRVIPAQFFIWWADGTHVWHHSVDAAIRDGVSSDARFAGPIVVLDLEALGTMLNQKAGRPLVHVEITDSVSGSEAS